MKKKICLVCFLFVLFFAGCSTQSNVIKTEPQVDEKATLSTEDTRFLKRKVAIARFSNETQYAKGAFYDKDNDPMGKQASDILAMKLASSGKFLLLERQDADKLDEEIRLNTGKAYSKIGADYLIIGSVTEYGRKNVGDVNLLSRSKTQVVEATVSVRLVDVSTGEIVYAEEAKGESETTSKTVLGLGERTGYDATLDDKAISAAISKLVENIINNCMDRPWRSYFLSYDDKGIIISGGKSQGIRVGDEYFVVKRGAVVENPQTGILMELPGQKAGKVKVTYMGGATEQSEFSLVAFTTGDIDRKKLSDFYVSEVEY